MKMITDFDYENKKVILRCDFNVSIKNGKIISDKKIIESLESINYLINKKAKVILMSHLDKVKSEEDKIRNTLFPVYQVLKEKLKTNVTFSKNIMGPELEKMINNLKSGEVLLIENTRYADLDNKKESSADISLSKYWASLADIFINDAFGMIHRRHASNYGIGKYLDSGIGFLIKKEIDGLRPLLNPEKPFIVVMGGAKIEDKIDLIKSIIKKCDNILVCGGIANTFLSLKYNVGASLISDASLDEVNFLLETYRNKIIMPIDVVVSNGEKYAIKQLNEIENQDVISDIGPKTINLFVNHINKAATILLNGTAGIYEKTAFSNGTKEILQAIADSDAKSIIGGGDAVSSSEYFKIDNFTFISTGGGATLYYIAYEKFNCLD